MRIAYMTHFYPPSPCGGAGYYTAAIAEAFQAGGATVNVLCADRWGEGQRHINGYSDDVRHGVSVRRLHINWRLAPAPFDYTYDNPALDPLVRDFVAGLHPDVVHITSCYTLSARVISTVKQLGIPVLVHLVDYWFICPRHTLLRKSGEICYGGKNAWDCQDCMLYATSIDRVTRKLLPGNTRSVFLMKLGKAPIATRQPGAIGMLGDMARRREYALEQLSMADDIISPSYALKDLYEQNGLPGHRIRVVRHGQAIDWADQVRRKPSPRLRLGFLGNVITVKGVHVLIDAFRRLQPNDRLELHIFGNDTFDQDYTHQLRSNLPANTVWHGAYERAQLPSILSEIDVVVVPSIWHENAPLVIQEAFAAGCPVLVSNLGGMAEVVDNFKNGLHFQVGSAEDLAAKIGILAANPSLLATMRANLPPVKPIQQERTELTQIYSDLILNNHNTFPATQHPA